MSSRPAQCSTGIPSAARQKWIKVYAARRSVTGTPASSGIVEAGTR